MGYRHTVRVRYGEVDQQGVVFNAHYMAYIDDALEVWTHGLGPLKDEHRWDMMLKKIELEWHSSVGNRDELVIDAEVERFGRTSWQVRFLGSCEGRPVFDALVTYVSVELGVNQPIETPEAIRDFLRSAS